MYTTPAGVDVEVVVAELAEKYPEIDFAGAFVVVLVAAASDYLSKLFRQNLDYFPDQWALNLATKNYHCLKGNSVHFKNLQTNIPLELKLLNVICKVYFRKTNFVLLTNFL